MSQYSKKLVRLIEFFNEQDESALVEGLKIRAQAEVGFSEKVKHELTLLQQLKNED